MRNRNINQKHRDCTKCDLIPCINLYNKGKDNLEGGELYVLETCLKGKKYSLCESGALLSALCQLSKEFTDAPSFELFHQCIRDLKASAFLIATGHYRTAIQILRPIIENWLAGLYWDFKLGESSGSEEDLSEYKKFRTDEKYEIPEKKWRDVFTEIEKPLKKRHLNQEFILRWMKKNSIIDGKFKQEINTICGELNKYLHPSFSTMETEKANWTVCPAWVQYSKEEYIKCVELFQDTATLLLTTLFDYLHFFSSPKLADDEFLEETLDSITLLVDVERDTGRKLINSKKLRRFINDITPE